MKDDVVVEMKDDVVVEMKEMKDGVVLKDDTDVEMATEMKFKYKVIYIVSSIVIVLSICILVPVTIVYSDDIHHEMFWLNQGCKGFIIYTALIISGYFAEKKMIKVNYTRKVSHLMSFFIPYLLDKLLIEFDLSILTQLWNVWFLMLTLYLPIEPLRKRFRIIRMAFASIDRPEDRPHTLFWAASQYAAAICVIVPFGALFNHIGRQDYVFIPLFVVGLGDGLAEPVGIRFGKNTYKTKGFFSSKEYTRSYEGSACVGFFSIVTICIFWNTFTTNELIFDLITIPIASMFTEAWSPHTWDTATLFLEVCTLLSIGYALDHEVW